MISSTILTIQIGLVIFLTTCLSTNGYVPFTTILEFNASKQLTRNYNHENDELPKFNKSGSNISRRTILTGATTSVISTQFFVGVNTASALDTSDYMDGPQGLKYMVTKKGANDAAKPQRAQKVKTSYSLYLNGFEEDGGKKLDSSKGIFGDKPFEFNVGIGGVIKGWDLSLMDMKEGEARKLIVPSDLGYGDKGAGGKIPGGATLYFEVELTEIGKMLNLNADQEIWLEKHPL